MVSLSLKPNIQLFAEPEPDTNNAAASQDAAQQDDAGQQENNLPKTQEELDALIESRVARERKRLARQQTKQVQPTEQQATETAQPQNPETDAMQKELISVRAQLEAMRSGVRADVAEDAVLLAIHQVEKDGDVPDDDTICEALKAVLKRHPDWKNSDKNKGGIKVGVVSDQESPQKSKALPEGRVIF